MLEPKRRGYAKIEATSTTSGEAWIRIRCRRGRGVLEVVAHVAGALESRWMPLGAVTTVGTLLAGPAGLPVRGGTPREAACGTEVATDRETT